MAKQRTPFVTGDKELDHILKTFPERELKKAVRQATRATVKNVVLPAYKANVQAAQLVETAAMRDAGKAKAVARSRTQYGHELNVDFDKVVAKRRAKGARVGLNKRKEIFRYLWAWEFGERNLAGLDEIPRPSVEVGGKKGSTTAVAPIRRALIRSKEAALLFFRQQLRVSLVAVAARAKLTMPRFRD